MDSLIYAYITDVFKLVYGIVGFVILAGLPVGMLLKAVSGKVSFF